jgi:hypothetical protein
MESESLSVWEKIDIEEYKSALPTPATRSSSPVENTESRINRLGWIGKPWFWTALNLFATLFWLYVILILFVSDVDRWIVSTVSPSWIWILDYRFSILLFLATLVVLIAKKWQIMFVLMYIWIFPIICLVWKAPIIYYRRRSWNLVMGTFQVLWSLGQSLRFAFGATTAFAFATLAIALDGPNELLASAVVTLMILWTWLVLRAVLYAIVPSKFEVYQQKLLGNILDNDRTWTLAALPAEITHSTVTRLNKSQIDRVVTQASMGLALYVVSALWAEKLDQYRKSRPSVVFSAFSVVALVTQGVAIFTLVNLGIFRIDASEFSYAESPHLATFARYSFSSMYAGEIEALRPVGTAASVVNLVETFSCAVIVLVLIVSMVTSVKESRDDHVAEESIGAMRRKADNFAEKLTGEYRLPLLDLLSRISELGGLFTNGIRQLVYAAVVAHRGDGKGNEHS